ncbi:uncharacterized protein MONBRDRAFT_25910 [Monosiga brevicollis MX1]|uniref:protein-tyrosine-phosphatase n=1 Tax=Monosiga brevicollis TaxID=81824 RepID=A9V0U1_MONBE|nr:uncharacterized protein MONBRDRAFT_25910 [Monosiga brevicollis MX1]EDQ88813.1 predicted protein [Monosiga brevicollis MX1]|eukprot:XP_001746426.1 hypothetical protein [Monosiga brevicollis MX1]
MAETWEIGLFIAGLILFGLLSAWAFYLTSDEYRLRRKRRQLGYEEDQGSIFGLLCALCIGPVNRSRWERQHKQFRTPDYGKPDKDWQKVRPSDEPGQEWQLLPRGDVQADGKRLATSKPAPPMADVAIAEENKEDSDDEQHDGIYPAAAPAPSKLPPARSISKLAIPDSDAPAAAPPAPASSAPDVAAKAREAVARAQLHMRAIEFAPAEAIRPPTSYSRPLSTAQLASVVHNMTITSLQDDFRTLPLHLASSKSLGEHLLRELREPRILPSVTTRIQLDRPPGAKISGFINANAVRGFQGNPMRFIVTQAPLSGFESGRVGTQVAFWSMVYQYQAPVVIMLIEPQPHRCTRYWPVPDGNLRSGPFEVRHHGFDKHRGFLVSSLSLTLRGKTHRFQHICLSGWNEHGLPRSSKSVIALLRYLRNLKVRGPIVVHDDRGLGPSGVFVASDYCIDQAQAGKVDVMQAVYTLRQDRAALVESRAEYQYIHRLVLGYLDGKDQKGAAVASNAAAQPPPKTKAMPSDMRVKPQPSKPVSSSDPASAVPEPDHAPPSYQPAPRYGNAETADHGVNRVTRRPSEESSFSNIAQRVGAGKTQRQYDVDHLGKAPTLPEH